MSIERYHFYYAQEEAYKYLALLSSQARLLAKILSDEWA